MAHLHFRDEKDRPTADLSIATRTVELIRERCAILIQLSTGVGLDVPFEARAGLVEHQPQMATLNPCSVSFGRGEFSNPPLAVERLAGRMAELGVKAELEIRTLVISKIVFGCVIEGNHSVSRVGVSRR